MHWEYAKLEEITKLSKGRKHSETDDINAYRYLQIEDLHGTGSNKYTTEKGVLCNESDLLIAWDGANAGKVGTGLNGMAGSTLARIIITSKKVNSRFLFWYMNSKFEEIKSKRTGATIPHVNGAELRSMKVPLPPLPIQQQIADTLDKADALRRKDQMLLDKYDELAQAVFYEMFGDVVRNEKGWRKAKVKEIALVKIGPFGSLLHKEDYISGGTPLINPSHIFKGNITEDSNLTISDNKLLELDNYKLHLGDIIMGRRGEMGRCALITHREDGWLCGTGSLFIRINSQQLLPNFLNTILSHQSMKKVIEALAKGVTMLNLNQSSIENLNIILPPLSMQLNYISAKDAIDKKRAILLGSTTRSLELFKSITSEYLN